MGGRAYTVERPAEAREGPRERRGRLASVGGEPHRPLREEEVLECGPQNPETPVLWASPCCSLAGTPIPPRLCVPTGL